MTDKSDLLAKIEDLRERLEARTAEWKQALGERDAANARARKWRSMCHVSSEHCRELDVTPATIVSWLLLTGWTDLGVDDCGWHVWLDPDNGETADLWRRPPVHESGSSAYKRAAIAIVYLANHLGRPEHEVLDEIAATLSHATTMVDLAGSET